MQVGPKFANWQQVLIELNKADETKTFHCHLALVYIVPNSLSLSPATHKAPVNSGERLPLLYWSPVLGALLEQDYAFV